MTTRSLPPDMSSEFAVRVVTCFLPVRQFITLHNLVWTFESFDYAIEMKATGNSYLWYCLLCRTEGGSNF